MNKYLRWFNAGAKNAAPSQKNTALPLIAFQSNSVANWSSMEHGQLSRDGFVKNPVVYRCIRLISEAAASMPWLLYSGEMELEEHPLLDLLNAPNAQFSGPEFMEAIYGHLLISGNAYIKQVSIDDTPRELHSLRPDRTKVLSDNTGWPVAYEYGAGRHKQRFEIDAQNKCAVLHLRVFNPLDDMNGMPPLHAAHMALNIHNSAATWNKALLDNSARPSGALVYTSNDRPNMSDEQFDRLKRELEDGYSGAHRAGRPMLLEGGLDWKAMGYSPKDMDFIEAKNSAARDIALAFGVPPMLLGIPGDNTFSNYKEANKALYRQTVLPLVNRTAKSIGNWLGCNFEEGLRLDIDLDKVEALSSDREALWLRLQQSDFLTEDEKRAAVGYSPIEEGA